MLADGSNPYLYGNHGIAKTRAMPRSISLLMLSARCGKWTRMNGAVVLTKCYELFGNVLSKTSYLWIGRSGSRICGWVATLPFAKMTWWRNPLRRNRMPF